MMCSNTFQTLFVGTTNFAYYLNKVNFKIYSRYCVKAFDMIFDLCFKTPGTQLVVRYNLHSEKHQLLLDLYIILHIKYG